MFINQLYYYLRPLIPRRLQLYVRRRLALKQRACCADIWPIDRSSATPPSCFTEWPGGKRFALVLTHDVETKQGHDKCRDLMRIEMELGMRSTFNFVPRRYDVSEGLRKELTENGFEVGVHGLYHDGKLYRSERLFVNRSQKINSFLKEWNSVGFRSPSMHKNLEWIHRLNIEYDSSTYDTDPFEPYSDAVGTIFPFIIKDASSGSSYVEMPYTLPQDSTLFVILQEKDIRIWKEKLDWVAEKGGMVLISTHPDYMHFNGAGLDTEEYPSEFYEELLSYVKERYKGQYWHALPRELARYWSKL